MTIRLSNIVHSKALQKFTQVRIFGLKIYHLASLMYNTRNQFKHLPGDKKSECNEDVYVYCFILQLLGKSNQHSI
jgi:hypothetical protein